MPIDFQVNRELISPSQDLMKIVEKTTEKYSSKGSFCRKVANFFKSFIGQSDWQKTIRVAKKMYRASIKNELLNQTQRVETKLLKATMKKVEKFVIPEFHTTIDLIMKTGVKAANDKEVTQKEENRVTQAVEHTCKQFERAGIQLYRGSKH